MARKKNENISFEESLLELETTVKKLEASDIKLDEALELFKKGMDLTTLLNSKIEDVSHQIEEIVEEANGKFILKPLKFEED